MKPKIDKTIRARMRRLLNFDYSISELASELECEESEIQSLITAGCPRRGDFINGADLRQWAGIPAPGGALINRENWENVQAFLSYLEEVQMNSSKTIICRRTQLRRLLEWAGSTPFPAAKDIRPSFPAFLASYRADGQEGHISGETARRTCETAQQFLEWCKGELPARYQQLSNAWIETLKPTRRRGLHSELKEHEFYTLEEVRRLVAVPADTLAIERDRAAAAFLYLSGMRIDAFLTLPVHCVDMALAEIQQVPALGVRTKNGKAAVTHLFSIPDLMDIVKAWDNRIRAELPGSALWYANLEGKGSRLSSHPHSSPSRVGNFRRDLRRLCKRAGVEYKSPHKFRHGNAVYGITHARNMREMKAVSMNLMHSSVTITDAIYANLSGDMARDVITNLGGGSSTPLAGDQSALILQVLAKLANNPGLSQKVIDLLL